MSKNSKKLLSALLAAIMTASSGAAVLADGTTDTSTASTAVTAEATTSPEETTAPEATATAEETAEPEATAAAEETTEPEATAAAEETAAPEETAEPEETAAPEDKYESDSYYKKALSLCKSLGVITGYDDGSIKPESTVTRAEMAAIILRMTATSSTSEYRNIFDDVDTSHWAATTIQTVADANIVNGMGDGTFNPDGDVLYEQAVKMVVCGMNYQYEAEQKGGYPEGYMAVASINLSLLDGVNAVRGEAIERGEIIKMVYNALLGPYHKVTGYINDAPIYDSDQDETLAKAKFDVYEEKGLLTSTPRLSITSTKAADGQITIDDETYICSLEDIDDYIANEITYYYKDDGKNDPEVVAVVVNPSKTSEVTIEADDVDYIKEPGTSGGTLKTESGKTYKLDTTYIIYNGDLITESMYDAAVKADTTGRFNDISYDGTDTGDKLSFTDFINPEEGKIRLVDNDGDNKYDVMFITSAETMLVTAATDKRIIGTIKGNAVTLDVDTAEDANLQITVTKDGETAKAKNLKKNEVVSVVRNLDEDVITLEQTSTTITGKISSFTKATDTDYAYVTINGDEYDVDINAVKDCTTGLEVTAYLNTYGKIGYVDTATVISSSEQYGWILSANMSESGDGYEVRIFAQDGTIATYQLAKTVDYWAPGATESESLSKSEMSKALKNITYNTISIVTDPTEIRLIKFSKNSKNEILKLYVAQILKSGLTKGSEFSSTTYDRNALVLEGTNLTGTVSKGNLVGNYYLNDGMIEFIVPENTDKMSETSTYAVNTASASAYLDKENGSSKNFIVGEFSDDKQTYPTIVIRFEGSDDDAALVTDYGTADNNPCFMLEKIYSGVDDDDNEVYTLVGYRNGGQVKYTTKKNTTLAKLAGAFTGTGSREYNATKLWDAVDGVTSDGKTAYTGAKELTDILEEGDVIGVAGNGSVLILMVDASELAESVRDGSFGDDLAYAGASSGRDSLYIGRVQDSDLGDNAVMTVSGVKLLFDAGNAMDTVIINEAGAVNFSSEDVSTIADVMDFDDDTLTGDYAFVRYASKGSLQEVFLFRFED